MQVYRDGPQVVKFNEANQRVLSPPAPPSLESRTMEETATAVEQVVNENNLFDDDTLKRGRIAQAPKPKSWAKLMTTGITKDAFKTEEEVKASQRIEHENGIFGSYCLEDVRSIAILVLQKASHSNVFYDCFNYETVKEIVASQKNVAAPNEHVALYHDNTKLLTTLAHAKKLGFALHYETKNNDLLQSRKIKVNPKEDWLKFNRIFKQNMIFFNPYMKDAVETEKLIDAFFEYATTNLVREIGVVTVMWNPERRDSLGVINVERVASKHHFRLIHRLDGRKFAILTKFKHLKNSTSLERTFTGENESSATAVISSKSTDKIMMFMHHNSPRQISPHNTIASVLLSMLQDRPAA